MNKLDHYRKQIDHIDNKMLKLFERRMNKVYKIYQYKKENNLSITSLKREEEMRKRLYSHIKSNQLLPYYEKFLSETINLSKAYQNNDEYNNNIIIGIDTLKDFSKYFNIDSKALIISDSLIPTSYVDIIKNSLKDSDILIIPSGECSKSWETLNMIFSYLIEHEYDRTSIIIGIGGGVVCDIANLASSLYLRGIKSYLIPTSLLAMVDACIGGKTAINFGGSKNQIGSFKQPSGILIDTLTLKTLDKRLFNEGMAEIIKIAAVSNEKLFIELEDENTDITKIVTEALNLKKQIVLSDEKDNGVRNILNFGHTIGHAIEAKSCGELLHGECVSVGMKYFTGEEAYKRIEKLLKKYNLPTVTNYSFDELLPYIIHDKKRKDDFINIIFVDKIGEGYSKKIKIIDLGKYFK